jgi:hypothetical protein
MKMKMAKKSKKSKEVYAGRSVEEWRNAGEKFGKWMDQRGKEVGKEMGGMGKRFRKDFERVHGKPEDWWCRHFSFIGPLVGSVFGVLLALVTVWILNLINLNFGNVFVTGLSSFILKTLPIFFGASLFFGYSRYFSRRYFEGYWIISPLISATGAVIIFWISVLILNFLNTFISSDLLFSIANLIQANLLAIFILFLVFGYVFVIVRRIFIHTFGF